MPRKKHTPEQIIAKLRQAEVADLTPENRSEPNVRLGRTKRGRDAEKETHT